MLHAAPPIMLCAVLVLSLAARCASQSRVKVKICSDYTCRYNCLTATVPATGCSLGALWGQDPGNSLNPGMSILTGGSNGQVSVALFQGTYFCDGTNPATISGFSGDCLTFSNRGGSVVATVVLDPSSIAVREPQAHWPLAPTLLGIPPLPPHTHSHPHTHTRTRRAL